MTDTRTRKLNPRKRIRFSAWLGAATLSDSKTVKSMWQTKSIPCQKAQQSQPKNRTETETSHTSAVRTTADAATKEKRGMAKMGKMKKKTKRLRGVKIVQYLIVTRRCGHFQTHPISTNRKRLVNLTQTICGVCEDEKPLCPTAPHSSSSP